MVNLTAYDQGLAARADDDDSDNGQMTDCPYRKGTQAHDSWWKGYSDWANPEFRAEVERLANASN